MKTGQNKRPERASQVPHQPLPRQIAESLGPRSRRALMHGTRRRILRVLSKGEAPKTLQGLAAMFPEASLSQVSYHVLVLGDCGSVAASEVQHAGGTLARSFVSTVAANPQIVAVLRATETMDDVH
jgi:DNA-binding transcriptional ArsR family regulator